MSSKNKTQFYLSERGIRYRLDGPISDCKSVCMLLRAIAPNLRNFETISRNSNRSLAEGIVARGKDKNYQKMRIKYLLKLFFFMYIIFYFKIKDTT